VAPSGEVSVLGRRSCEARDQLAAYVARLDNAVDDQLTGQPQDVDVDLVLLAEPIDVRGRYDGVPPGRARREITDRVMTEIQKLTGQEAAGVYNDRAPDA